MTGSIRIELHTAARVLLDEHGPAIAAAKADGELLLGILHRLREAPSPTGGDGAFAVAFANGVPAAIAAVTAPSRGIVLALVSESERALEALAERFHRDGVELRVVLGPTAAVVPFAARFAARARVALRTTRLMLAHELHAVRTPSAPAGRARLATADDSELVVRWAAAFAEAVGNDPRDSPRRITTNLAASDVMLWDDDGPASMAAIVRRTPRSASIAFVYTPEERRGRGYASALVAALSQRELDAGCEWCSLFTDSENETTSRIYQAIGYEPRSEYREIWLSSAARPDASPGSSARSASS